MQKKIWLTLILVILGAALVIGKAVAIPMINVVEPETVNSLDGVSPPPPLLLPPDDAGYVEQDPVSAARSAGRTIAHLPEAPVDAVTTEVRLLPQEPWESPESHEYAVKSVVRYSGDGSTTVVSLAVPSPAAQRNKTVYGNKTITLSSGEKAFIDVDRNGVLPRSLTIIRGNHIITIATDRSESDLLEFASKVQVLSP